MQFLGYNPPIMRILCKESKYYVDCMPLCPSSCHPTGDHMTTKTLLIVTTMIAALAGAFISNAISHKTTTTPQRETTYERIIRTHTVRCGYILWPPFITQDANTKKMGGFEYEYTEAIAKSLNLNVTWSEIFQGQQVEALKANKIDAVCGDGPFLTSAATYLQYTEPMLYEDFYFYVRADDHRFDGAIDKVNDSKITMVTMDGDISLDIATQNYPKTTIHQLPNSADPSQLMLDVVNHKADIVLNDALSGVLYMTSNPGTLRRVALEKPVAYVPAQFSVLRGNGDLADMLSQSIRTIRARGMEAPIIAGIPPEYKDCFHRAATLFAP